MLTTTPPTPAFLAARRTGINRGLEARVQGRLVVVPYTLALPGRGHQDHLAELKGLAARHEWELTDTERDDCGDLDPALRRGWTCAVRRLADGRAHAIAAVSQVTVSAHPALYDRELDRIQRSGGGLYLLRPETQL
ncbi:hypothetical protein ABT354_19545 [Streptomyces sp. NPDC000594]|uniref:hypothetical protein n=1 Tax=Streptomyces sp. NPDC000594 TaxID=3154261 RepID=UPI00332A20DD